MRPSWRNLQAGIAPGLPAAVIGAVFAGGFAFWDPCDPPLSQEAACWALEAGADSTGAGPPPEIPGAIVVSKGTGGPPATGQDNRALDRQFIRELRAQRLFCLADRFCRQKLARSDLDPVARIELTIEWSLVLVEQARHSAPQERPELWNQARAIVGELAATSEGSSQAYLLRFQEGRVWAEQGRLAVEEAELVGANALGWEEARSALRRARECFAALEAAVEEAIRKYRPDEAGGMSAGGLKPLSLLQLAELKKAITYERALAASNLARAYPAESPDRAAAAAEAVELFKSLARMDSSDPLAWPSRLAELTGYRMLGDYQQAQRRLEALEKLDPPAKIAPHLAAERLRLLVVQKEWALATEQLSLLASDEASWSPELAEAVLEYFMAAWDRASAQGQKDEAAALQQKLRDQVALIRQRYGAYWGRRAQMILSRRLATVAQDDWQLLAQAAEHAFHGGQYAEAVAAFDRASRLAEQNGASEQAFVLGFQAATVCHLQANHVEAAARYRRLALRFPQNPKAAEAHFLSVYHVGQLLRFTSERVLQTSDRGEQLPDGSPKPLPGDQKAERSGKEIPPQPTPSAEKGSSAFSRADSPEQERTLALWPKEDLPVSQVPPSRRDLLDLCVRLADEHGQLWPRTDSAYQVDWFLARLLQAEKRWHEAIAYYRRLPRDWPQQTEVIERLWTCYRQCRREKTALLAQAPAAEGIAEIGDLAKKAVEWFAAYCPGSDEPSERWTPAARQAAMRAAQIYLECNPPEVHQAEEILRRALAPGSEMPGEWQLEAQTVLLTCCVLQNRREEASALAEHLFQSNPQAALSGLKSLASLSADLPRENRRSVAEVLLIILQKRAEKDPSLKTDPRWQELLLEAISVSGPSEEGAKLASALARESASEPRIQRLHAILLLQLALSEQASAQSVQQAAGYWRELEKRASPRSPTWYEAKASLALLALRSGQVEHARRIVRLVELVNRSIPFTEQPPVRKLGELLPAEWFEQLRGLSSSPKGGNS